MQEPVVIIGVGEMAGVFARGLLRLGHPIIPVTRDTDMQQLAGEVPTPRLVLVAVGENDLQTVLEQVPASWRERLGLLQNELLPHDWQAHGIDTPTVIPVWFEKKKGQDVRVLLPSPVFGPQAGLLCRALAAIAIPTRQLDNREQLDYELLRKNVYILTTNIAGLETAGTVEELWRDHEALARAVANEVMDIQAWLTGVGDLPREQLIAGMLEGFAGDPTHLCMGRSAPGRLARALRHADQAGLAVPNLRRIQAAHA